MQSYAEQTASVMKELNNYVFVKKIKKHFVANGSINFEK